MSAKALLLPSITSPSEGGDGSSLNPACAAAPPRCWFFAATVGIEGLHIPTQVCELLVDSLQGHGDGVVCGWEEVVVSIRRVLVFSRAQQTK